MVLKSIRSKCLTFRLNFAHFNFCSIRWFISIYYYCYGASDHTFATHRTFKWEFVTSFQQMALPQLLNWTNLFEHRFVSWLRASPLPFVWGNIFLWDFSPDFKQKKKCYFQRRRFLKDKNMFAQNIETQSILIIHTQFSSFFFEEEVQHMKILIMAPVFVYLFKKYCPFRFASFPLFFLWSCKFDSR